MRVSKDPDAGAPRGGRHVTLAAPASAEEFKLNLKGATYTKWLWGNQRTEGSLYNFTTRVPGEAWGDNGQGSELELIVDTRISKKVVGVRPPPQPLLPELLDQRRRLGRQQPAERRRASAGTAASSTRARTSTSSCAAPRSPSTPATSGSTPR